MQKRQRLNLLIFVMKKKNEALYNLKTDLRNFSSELIQINNQDVENARSMNMSSAMIDRLTLNEDRIDGMVNCLNEIINLNDLITDYFLFFIHSKFTRLH